MTPTWPSPAHLTIWPIFWAPFGNLSTSFLTHSLSRMWMNSKSSEKRSTDSTVDQHHHGQHFQGIPSAKQERCTNIIQICPDHQTVAENIRRSSRYSGAFLQTYRQQTQRASGVQIEELKKIKICILDIILKAETSFKQKEIVDYQNIVDQYLYMRKLADQFNQNQIERIRSDTSKTRLSILYYAIVGNCIMIGKQNIKLLEIFNESFKFDRELSDSYLFHRQPIDEGVFRGIGP
jgi:hypothetical protein